MTMDDLLQYYDYLNRLAGSKLGSQDDADDLVADTYLAAFAYLKLGGKIEHPKTWLVSVLMNKLNSRLRKKYSRSFVSIDLFGDSLSSDDDFERGLIQSEEANELRRELLMLSRLHREVLVRYYFNGEDIASIAEALGVPEGTVKRRLFDGRQTLKKGLEQMNTQENKIPRRLNIWNSGDFPTFPTFPNGNDLIAHIEVNFLEQNILYEAYEKPLKPSEIARALGVPAPYVESELDFLADNEVMAKTPDGKYYTDFLIKKAEFNNNSALWQNEFVKRNFDVFWKAMSGLMSDVEKTDIAKKLNPRQLKKLQRWAVMRLLQNFRQDLLDLGDNFECPLRNDGRRWFIGGSESEFFNDQSLKIGKYHIGSYGYSGLRNSCFWLPDGIVIRMHEFDTDLYDNPHRWCHIGDYDSLANLLWGLFNGIPVEECNISTIFLEKTESLIIWGILARENGKIIADIPILSESEYAVILKLIEPWHKLLTEKLGKELGEYLSTALEPIPPHLKSVPDWLRRPFDYTAMSAVREAFDRGLWLSDIDYCCPPMVMRYREK